MNPKAYSLKKKKSHKTAILLGKSWRKKDEDKTDKFEWQRENITLKTEIFKNHGYYIHKFEKVR